MSTQHSESLLNALNACAAACDHCASACLQEEDVKMMAGCIALDIDCAQVCRVTAGLLARGSALAGVLCQACAAVCEACAAECGRHRAPHCQACAAACSHCAQACRRQAGAAASSQQGGAASPH